MGTCVIFLWVLVLVHILFGLWYSLKWSINLGKDAPKKQRLSNKKTFHIVVSGQVQGVGFRYFVKEKALACQLTGWVRNRANRKVEMEVEGDTDQLEIFIDFLKIGNGYSRVVQLNRTEIAPIRNFTSFQIRY